MPLPRTYVATPKDIEKKWILVDAEDVVLGRLASVLAMRLRGKHKPSYTPNMDCGDHVIVINAEKVKLTGGKRTAKTYYWHTGYPGGIKSTTPEKILTGKTPSKVIQLAVKRMIPKGPLGRKVLKQLHIYSGNVHPYEAQKPEAIDIKSLNRKNS